MTARIEIEGKQQIQDILQRYVDKLEDPVVLYQKIDDELTNIANESIATQKSALDESAYAPLSLFTQKKKNKGPKDALKGTLVNVSLVNTTATKGTLEASMPYGSKQQNGDPNNMLFGKRSPIPARKFIGIDNENISPKLKQKIDEIIKIWFTNE